MPDATIPASTSIDAIRGFLLQIEKTLTIRRLYAPKMRSYRDTARELAEKFRLAVDDGPFTLRVQAEHLAVGSQEILHRPDKDDSFFFPWYRDGLRELRFEPETEPEEIEAIIEVLRAEQEHRIPPGEDTVSYLWRADLHGVTFAAIDGIGDEEGEGGLTSSADEYRALVADVVSKIKDPAPPAEGQSYSFRLDADTRLAASDLEYDASTAHRPFADNPRVLRLAPSEAQAIREEVRAEEEGQLLDRFVSILFTMLRDPRRTAPTPRILAVIRQMIEGVWRSRDLGALTSLLGRLATAAEDAPEAETRREIRELLDGFLSPARIEELFTLVQEGSLTLDDAIRLWELGGVDVFRALLGFSSDLREGPLRDRLGQYLKLSVASDPDLLRDVLGQRDPKLVLAGLRLLDERVEGVYSEQITALAGHPAEAVRLKALQAVARIGGPEAPDRLWNAMENDPAKPVRLLAFRLISGTDPPGLAERLEALVRHDDFRRRPLWECRKYVGLLARMRGEAAAPLFRSWLPSQGSFWRRWIWSGEDKQAAELGLLGLAESGQEGTAEVAKIADGRGKLAVTARAVLDRSHHE